MTGKIKWQAAKTCWAEERDARPIPIAVHFERETERIVVDFTNGAAFLVPARALEGLQQATSEEIAEVELLGETGLHWERLDVDYTIQGLMAGIFGSRAFLEAQRRGGQSRSPAKIAASRANGAKGGRPRKIAG
ncbi:hypothetical protein ASE36_03200 [Rhizobium sp. Root274]|uniref:DUF2442 domain-containing protein n=1 Tax=unclassified Rhizobium TaxID=2613769 RepID=UPI000714EA7D|nr:MULTISPECIES: DUF2442 domain-containing protein [unclassified Rhizobium]KQW31286.1 hypothetical protein ASC71_03195 [Rhizobium sp. Root1240]KRD33835.1 hypothetical protein ASE36_03200 [Rhizobium sp. Root274]